jgi:hypothetical protein
MGVVLDQVFNKIIVGIYFSKGIEKEVFFSIGGQKFSFRALDALIHGRLKILKQAHKKIAISRFYFQLQSSQIKNLTKSKEEICIDSLQIKQIQAFHSCLKARSEFIEAHLISVKVQKVITYLFKLIESAKTKIDNFEDFELIRKRFLELLIYSSALKYSIEKNIKKEIYQGYKVASELKILVNPRLRGSIQQLQQINLMENNSYTLNRSSIDTNHEILQVLKLKTKIQGIGFSPLDTLFKQKEKQSIKILPEKAFEKISIGVDPSKIGKNQVFFTIEGQIFFFSELKEIIERKINRLMKFNENIAISLSNYCLQSAKVKKLIKLQNKNYSVGFLKIKQIKTFQRALPLREEFKKAEATVENLYEIVSLTFLAIESSIKQPEMIKEILQIELQFQKYFLYTLSLKDIIQKHLKEENSYVSVVTSKLDELKEETLTLI